MTNPTSNIVAEKEEEITKEYNEEEDALMCFMCGRPKDFCDC